MCACRCGIRVHLNGNRVRYIEGNPEHPVNRGVLCAKGSAGIMQHESPARLTAPLKRVGPRGSGEFETIGWDEALTIAAHRLGRIRAEDPRKLAFFTGRDQSQALTSWWAERFGTPNYAAHGGFCSVNMAAAGMYTLGSAFWEFTEPDWERTRYFLLFGVAEDHSSNPIKIGLSRLKARGARIVSVNPVQTGYSGIADEWLGITPGSDGLFVLALIHELLRTGRIDADYLARYTNAGHLVIDAPGSADDGLIARDGRGAPLCADRRSGELKSALDAGAAAALIGPVVLADGRPAVPAFERLARRYLGDDYSPGQVAGRTGIDADTIRRIAAELAHAAFDQAITLPQPWTDAHGRRHETTLGRPVSMHAMRGISAHANGFHTCRAIHLLQLLLGSVDVPGGLRHKPPYPKAPTDLPRPHAATDASGVLRGPHLGYPHSPEDLLVDADGEPARIDKAFSWEAPLAAHGMMHTVIANAWARDPYPIDTLFMYMANMAWNSSMNTAGTMEMLTDRDPETGDYRIPFIIYSDAYYSETVAYADLVLPDTTYLERWDAISLLDRPISDADAAADAIRQPLLAPDRDVRPFQDVLLDLGARLGLPGLVDATGAPRYPGGYSDYLVNHQRKPGIGTLAGWRDADGAAEGRGAPNPEQLQRYVDNGCHWRAPLPAEQHYYRFANRAYLDYANAMGFRPNADAIVMNVYAEPLQRFRLAAQGHGEIRPPARHRERIERYFDPLPFWYPPPGGAEPQRYPLHALTQRPMAMYHSWGGQNAWLRQLHTRNVLYVPDAVAEQHELDDGDFVRLTSRSGTIVVPVQRMRGVNGATVWTWNAIGKRSGAWNLAPGAPEASRAFLLNHLIEDLLPRQPDGYRYSNSDPVTGQAAWYDLRVRLQKVAGAEAEIAPQFGEIARPPGLAPAPRDVGYDAGAKDRQ